MRIKIAALSTVLVLGSMLPMLSQAGVIVAVAPPAPVVEVVPTLPGPGYVWLPGCWTWNGAAYIWAPGRYARAPWVGAAWAPGRWVGRRGGWAWRGGYWRR